MGVTVSALLNLSAAFDTADHSNFLRRLNHTYGLSLGTVLRLVRWMQSFSLAVSSRCHFAGQRSTRTSADVWCAPRSVSDPIPCFLTLQTSRTLSNSIVSVCTDTQTRIGLYVHVRHLNAPATPATAARLIGCTQTIDEWMSSNRPKMNFDKTQNIWQEFTAEADDL